MKRITLRMLLAIALVTGPSVLAQGTFQNLDFEDANIVPVVSPNGYPNAVDVADALPGWTVDYGSTQQAQITYNDQSLGGTWITLLANGYSTLTTLTPIDGNFSVLLISGLYQGEPAAATISQTGQIPLGTQSLLFDVTLNGGPFLPQVSIGNDSLTLFPVGTGVGTGGVNYSIYGANISAWSGQIEKLSFTAPAGYGKFEFDDISFSPGAVPEPSPFTLAVVGGVLFALYRRIQR